MTNLQIDLIKALAVYQGSDKPLTLQNIRKKSGCYIKFFRQNENVQ